MVTTQWLMALDISCDMRIAISVKLHNKCVQQNIKGNRFSSVHLD